MNDVVRGVLRWGKVVLGFVLMIAAFVLGFVPGIPGFPLALIGLALLATEFLWARNLNEWAKAKYKQSIAKLKGKREEQKPHEPG